jgi:LacI family transcriptional regulator
VDVTKRVKATNGVPAAKITVRDVAREAGLSVASVSRTLTGARPVRPEIADRVRQAATKLNYEPDYLGRSLSLRKTATIGLIVPDIASPFFPALAQAIESALRANGLTLLLMDAQNDPAWELDCVHELLARRVDGLLISPCHRTKSRPAVLAAASRVPIAQIDRYATAAAHRVTTDPAATIHLAVSHLVSQGCRSFAFVGAMGSASPAFDRKRSYQRLIAKVDANAPRRTLDGTFTADWGFEAAELILRRWPTVDAVICANDLIALGLVQGLLDHGRTIPAQIAVTGCDDTYFATASRPAITSVAQPVKEMAERAVSLVTTDDSTPAPGVFQLSPTLHPRASTQRTPDDTGIAIP